MSLWILHFVKLTVKSLLMWLYIIIEAKKILRKKSIFHVSPPILVEPHSTPTRRRRLKFERPPPDVSQYIKMKHFPTCGLPPSISPFYNSWTQFINPMLHRQCILPKPPRIRFEAQPKSKFRNSKCFPASGPIIFYQHTHNIMEMESEKRGNDIQQQ